MHDDLLAGSQPDGLLQRDAAFDFHGRDIDEFDDGVSLSDRLTLLLEAAGDDAVEGSLEAVGIELGFGECAVEVGDGLVVDGLLDLQLAALFGQEQPRDFDLGHDIHSGVLVGEQGLLVFVLRNGVAGRGVAFVDVVAGLFPGAVECRDGHLVIELRDHLAGLHPFAFVEIEVGDGADAVEAE